ncbi:hypothetical protein [Ktedonobacter sp. SOSP1-85]|uniref:hypothetical protein n=1 Tax=Ktedonobacter sp. SOSP1-85 TaxID=2778367 RepID=UPI001915727C|nr:hypothetical protein [Ktedonobacter sp. SOSP1-85]
MQQIHAIQIAPSCHLPLITICEQMLVTHATLSLTTVLPPSLPFPGRPEDEEIIAEVAFEQGRIARCHKRTRRESPGHSCLGLSGLVSVNWKLQKEKGSPILAIP